MATQKEMRLKCKPGDKVDIYVDARKRISHLITPFTITGTIIGRYADKTCLIGWLPNEEKPNNTAAIKCYIKASEPIADYYSYTNCVMWDGEAEDGCAMVETIYPKFDGATCCKCKEPHYMAAPNQPDGTFICRLCIFNPFRNWRPIE